MKKLIALVGLGLTMTIAAPVFAGAQQNKMKACSAEAKGMKGAERKAFMSKCLKKDYVPQGAAAPAAENKAEAASAPASVPSAAAPAPTPAPALAAQQDKMKKCSAEAKAKGLKGSERRTFMGSCLKG